MIIQWKRNKKYSEILEEWLNERKMQVKESSFLKYQTTIESLIKIELGNIEFKKLTVKNIDDFFNSSKMIECSDSTRTIVLIIIKSSIRYGIERKYRKSFDEIKLKIKKPKNKIIYFTRKEQEILDAYLKENLNLRNLGILIALYTGIRIGELCGLKKKDFDFINGTIAINRTVQRVKDTDKNSSKKTKLLVSVPKTEYSIRTIPLPELLISILSDYIDSTKNEEFYIFTNSETPKDPRAFEKYFSSVLKKCQIRNLNFHSLRHTFATRSREAGIDIKVLSELLGHSSYHITQDIYVHISSELKKESINSLANYLNVEKFEECN